MKVQTPVLQQNMGDKGNITHFTAEKHWLTMRSLKEIEKVLFLLPLIQEQLLFLFKTSQKGQERAKEGNTMFISQWNSLV